MSAMVIPEGADTSRLPPTSLLQTLSISPEIWYPRPHTSVFASLLFSHLLHSSPRCKTPNSNPNSILRSRWQLFHSRRQASPITRACHSGRGRRSSTNATTDPAEHLSLVFLSRSKTDTSELESREWDRLTVGYLTLPCQWLWEDLAAVRDFFSSGGLGILVDPIDQVTETDFFIPNPILNCPGVDTLLGRMARLRDDEPKLSSQKHSYSIILALRRTYKPHLQATTAAGATAKSDAGEVWLDWAFVDSGNLRIRISWLLHLCAETAMLISTLQDTLRSQSQEIEHLRFNNKTASSRQWRRELDSFRAALKASEEKQKKTEKEQEDLLVLLDEASMKRKRDKAEDEGDEDDE
ncbi:hypothetical protein BT96DRAFT_999738 [Gymnopus androsaceus JB14]|uniref:Uncharacterized protein n=1 Tax=Gymnopus androsaceus JB14 TaxID=1447944 RepID=A0A6A4H5W2_9AGAR|nr:hypothetical protein BT96DRAFT_999738 [Gymnopus androsaceus JB14]